MPPRKKRPLRAATEADAEEAAEKAKPKTITEAAASGSTRDLLVALRDRLAKAVENPTCPPRDLASLSRRLHEITRDIEAIDAAAGEGGMSDAVDTPDEAFDEEAL